MSYQTQARRNSRGERGAGPVVGRDRGIEGTRRPRPCEVRRVNGACRPPWPGWPTLERGPEAIPARKVKPLRRALGDVAVGEVGAGAAGRLVLGAHPLDP